jgi:hypothetical protein
MSELIAYWPIFLWFLFVISCAAGWLLFILKEANKP